MADTQEHPRPGPVESWQNKSISEFLGDTESTMGANLSKEMRAQIRVLETIETGEVLGMELFRPFTEDDFCSQFGRELTNIVKNTVFSPNRKRQKRYRNTSYSKPPLLDHLEIQAPQSKKQHVEPPVSQTGDVSTVSELNAVNSNGEHTDNVQQCDTRENPDITNPVSDSEMQNPPKEVNGVDGLETETSQVSTDYTNIKETCADKVHPINQDDFSIHNVVFTTETDFTDTDTVNNENNAVPEETNIAATRLNVSSAPSSMIIDQTEDIGDVYFPGATTKPGVFVETVTELAEEHVLNISVDSYPVNVTSDTCVSLLEGVATMSNGTNQNKSCTADVARNVVDIHSDTQSDGKIIYTDIDNFDPSLSSESGCGDSGKSLIGDTTATNDDTTATNGDTTATNGDTTATNSDTTATNGDNTATNDDTTATNGDTTATNGDTTATNGDTTATNDDTTATNGDTTATNGDTTATNDDTTATNGDTTATNDDTTATNGDTTATNSDTTATNGDTIATNGDTTATNDDNTATFSTDNLHHDTVKQGQDNVDTPELPPVKIDMRDEDQVLQTVFSVSVPEPMNINESRPVRTVTTDCGEFDEHEKVTEPCQVKETAPELSVLEYIPENPIIEGKKPCAGNIPSTYSNSLAVSSTTNLIVKDMSEETGPTDVDTNVVAACAKLEVGYLDTNESAVPVETLPVDTSTLRYSVNPELSKEEFSIRSDVFAEAAEINLDAATLDVYTESYRLPSRDHSFSVELSTTYATAEWHEEVSQKTVSTNNISDAFVASPEPYNNKAISNPIPTTSQADVLQITYIAPREPSLVNVVEPSTPLPSSASDNTDISGQDISGDSVNKSLIEINVTKDTYSSVNIQTEHTDPVNILTAEDSITSELSHTFTLDTAQDNSNEPCSENEGTSPSRIGDPCSLDDNATQVPPTHVQKDFPDGFTESKPPTFFDSPVFVVAEERRDYENTEEVLKVGSEIPYAGTMSTELKTSSEVLCINPAIVSTDFTESGPGDSVLADSNAKACPEKISTYGPNEKVLNKIVTAESKESLNSSLEEAKKGYGAESVLANDVNEVTVSGMAWCDNSDVSVKAISDVSDEASDLGNTSKIPENTDESFVVKDISQADQNSSSSVEIQVSSTESGSRKEMCTINNTPSADVTKSSSDTSEHDYSGHLENGLTEIKHSHEQYVVNDSVTVSDNSVVALDLGALNDPSNEGNNRLADLKADKTSESPADTYEQIQSKTDDATLVDSGISVERNSASSNVNSKKEKAFHEKDAQSSIDVKLDEVSWDIPISVDELETYVDKLINIKEIITEVFTSVHVNQMTQDFKKGGDQSISFVPNDDRSHGRIAEGNVECSCTDRSEEYISGDCVNPAVTALEYSLFTDGTCLTTHPSDNANVPTSGCLTVTNCDIVTTDIKEGESVQMVEEALRIELFHNDVVQNKSKDETNDCANSDTFSKNEMRDAKVLTSSPVEKGSDLIVNIDDTIRRELDLSLFNDDDDEGEEHSSTGQNLEDTKSPRAGRMIIETTEEVEDIETFDETITSFKIKRQRRKPADQEKSSEGDVSSSGLGTEGNNAVLADNVTCSQVQQCSVKIRTTKQDSSTTSADHGAYADHDLSTQDDKDSHPECDSFPAKAQNDVDVKLQEKTPINLPSIVEDADSEADFDPLKDIREDLDTLQCYLSKEIYSGHNRRVTFPHLLSVESGELEELERRRRTSSETSGTAAVEAGVHELDVTVLSLSHSEGLDQISTSSSPEKADATETQKANTSLDTNGDEAAETGQLTDGTVLYKSPNKTVTCETSSSKVTPTPVKDYEETSDGRVTATPEKLAHQSRSDIDADLPENALCVDDEKDAENDNNGASAQAVHEPVMHRPCYDSQGDLYSENMETILEMQKDLMTTPEPVRVLGGFPIGFASPYDNRVRKAGQNKYGAFKNVHGCTGQHRLGPHICEKREESVDKPNRDLDSHQTVKKWFENMDKMETQLNDSGNPPPETEHGDSCDVKDSVHGSPSWHSSESGDVMNDSLDFCSPHSLSFDHSDATSETSGRSSARSSRSDFYTIEVTKTVEIIDSTTEEVYISKNKRKKSKRKPRSVKFSTAPPEVVGETDSDVASSQKRKPSEAPAETDPNVKTTQKIWV